MVLHAGRKGGESYWNLTGDIADSLSSSGFSVMYTFR